MTGHSICLVGRAKDQDRHALNGMRHASKVSSANPLWSSAPCATLGWAACIKNARAPAVINHCSSCKRQDKESGPSKPGSGCGSLMGNSLDMGAPLAQWIKRIELRDVCISIFVSTIGVGSDGYGS